MLTVLIVSQILSWIVILGLGLALLALARQVGVLHVRLAPAGALLSGKGPVVGEAAPVLDAVTLDGAPLAIGKPAGRSQLLLFVSPHCPLCKELIPVAKNFARTEKLDIVFVGDDEAGEQRAMVARLGMEGLPFVNSSIVGRAFHVDRLPHAALIGADGTLISKALVNSREHLESMITAHEMGVVSVQDYLKNSKAPHSKTKVA
ncbi:MAG TPA: thioredoxin-like domain-containing protein [Rhizomicrobium sp.]|jgi:methylamine dehydrogenase accessory protein MauD|nr:thioredoxin-like domain-containing protein [Rhizomicrobium sp.]HEX4027390.1 thioredoxin-like domain-containing protein [Rhizomicrobium sp.]